MIPECFTKILNHPGVMPLMSEKYTISQGIYQLESICLELLTNLQFLMDLTPILTIPFSTMSRLVFQFLGAKRVNVDL